MIYLTLFLNERSRVGQLVLDKTTYYHCSYPTITFLKLYQLVIINILKQKLKQLY